MATKSGKICLHSDAGETSVEDRIIEALENLGFECEVVEDSDGTAIVFTKEVDDGEDDRTPAQISVKFPLTIDPSEEVEVETDLDDEEESFRD